MRWLGIGALALLAIIVVGGLGLLALLYYQAHRPITGKPQYVALGSSFAAGIGLGPRLAGSPLVCQRTGNSYPQQLARLRGLSLVDMTCSGATTKHVLHGGQVFLGPQLDGLSAETTLVTMTAGGNDISYVGDLALMGARRGGGVFGWATGRFWGGPSAADKRDFAGLRADLVSTLREIHRRAPRARIVVASYPTILPATGGCAKLGITEEEAAMMRAVGNRLAVVTQDAAREGGATFVDMNRIGADHHACSAEPWVNGWKDAVGTQFHPTLAGATAIAREIARMLDAPADGEG